LCISRIASNSLSPLQEEESHERASLLRAMHRRRVPLHYRSAAGENMLDFCARWHLDRCASALIAAAAPPANYTASEAATNAESLWAFDGMDHDVASAAALSSSSSSSSSNAAAAGNPSRLSALTPPWIDDRDIGPKGDGRTPLHYAVLHTDKLVCASVLSVKSRPCLHFLLAASRFHNGSPPLCPN
jgi:hypothetical protein